MYVSRELALEILGLGENFTQEEVNKNFRKLSKMIHPDLGGDENLFKFIMCCKEVLLYNSKINTTQQTHKASEMQENKKDSKKKSVYVNLSDLYDIYDSLDDYIEEYDITDIKGIARIFIIPCKNKKYCESANIHFSQEFKEFEKLNFANFSTTVKLPENLKKFKKFKIRVEFMGETFEFTLSMKKPFHIVKYKKYSRFNSIIELKFE